MGHHLVVRRTLALTIASLLPAFAGVGKDDGRPQPRSRRTRLGKDALGPVIDRG
jgi:hypothetical protein